MAITVCGEALIDLMGDSDGTTPVVTYGGSPMNTAVALAKLGDRVRFLGRLGNDRYADELAEHLLSNGVDVSLVVRTTEPTSIARVTKLSDGVNEYDFQFESTANFSWKAGDFPKSVGDWLHFGSLVYLVEPGANVFLQWAERTTAPMSVDLNIRPSVEPDRERYMERVIRVLRMVGARAGIVKLSMDDLSWLFPSAQQDLGSAITIVRDWLGQYGISLVVVTLGEGGSLAVQPGGKLTLVPGFPVRVVDTVGSGDVFMAGFLSIWLAGNEELTLALRYGNAAAALACTRVGANPPTGDEVEAFLLSQVSSSQ